MNYLRAIAGIERGFAVRRAAWLENEFVETVDAENLKYSRTERGMRYRNYRPSVEDMFADDWELIQ